MDTEIEIDAPSTLGIQLPIILLALAAAGFLAAQIGALNRGGKTIRWQLDSMDKQIANLKVGKSQYDDLVAKRVDLLKQSEAVQSQYSALLNDVMDLAKSDPDVKKLVEKWGVQRQTPPPQSAAPAPAAPAK